MFSNYSKKLFIFAASTLSVFSISNTKAADSEYYLQQIMNNTQVIKTTDLNIQQTTNTIQSTTANILQKVDSLPLILEKLGEFIEAWLKEDESDTTAKMLMPTFSDLGDQIQKNIEAQLKLQPLLNKDLFGDKPDKAVNDIAYSTLLGMPLVKDPTGKSAYNYVLNSSGINVPHVMPTSGWGGSPEDRARYRAYYNTTMAVESFNGYVLSLPYIEGLNSNFNELQKKLISQATDAETWFAEVASEKIGIVLRQLLIYQSQIFLMLTQLVQTQKQMVTAQAMTNALLISSGMSDEALLLAKAQGVRPAS